MLSERRRQIVQASLGSVLKEARLKEGFTQKSLGDAIGLEYHSMISQMELGYMSIPAPLWRSLADALKLGRVEFTLRCLLEIQPEVFSALFGNKSMSEVTKALEALEKGKFEDGAEDVREDSNERPSESDT